MKNLLWSCLAVLVLAGSGVRAQEDNQAQDMQEAMKALGALMNAGATNTAAAVHQRQLKALLPAEFEGMKRTASEAGKNAAFGMNVVYAEARYGNDESDVTVKISDISAMGPFMKMAQFAWTQTEMERESDTGFERTTRIDGHPAQERFENAGQRGGIEVIVDGRFMVEVDGNGLDMEKLHGLLKAIDLGKLAALKPEPAAP